MISFDVPRGLGETVTTMIFTFLVGKFHKHCFSTVAGRGGIPIFLFFDICVLHFVYIYIYMLYLYLFFVTKVVANMCHPKTLGRHVFNVSSEGIPSWICDNYVDMLGCPTFH